MAGDGRGRRKKPRFTFLPLLLAAVGVFYQLVPGALHYPALSLEFRTTHHLCLFKWRVTLLKTPDCVTSLASAVSLETLSAPNSLFTTLLDCLKESSVSCQESDIQEF